MEKEFIPYEQALDLKELGFDEPCFGFYNIKGKFIKDFSVTKDIMESLEIKAIELQGKICLSPTFSQAFRWFREKYKLQTRPVFKMIDETEFEYSFMPNDLKNKWYKTYEEAELECLKKLIEIVKNKNK